MRIDTRPPLQVSTTFSKGLSMPRSEVGYLRLNVYRAGNRSVTTVPLPTSLLRSISPSWRWTIP